MSVQITKEDREKLFRQGVVELRFPSSTVSSLMHKQLMAIEKFLSGVEQGFLCVDVDRNALSNQDDNGWLQSWVSPSNVDKMEENLLALKDLGITTMQFGYELGALWERENRNKYVENLLYCIDKYHTVPSGDDPGFQIQNTPSSEPMLGNPFFACDVDGRLYQGCAVVLEKTLPTFNETAKIGHVHDYQTLEGVQKDRLAQVKHFLDGTRKSPEEYRRLHSNMHLGYQVRTALHAKRHNV